VWGLGKALECMSDRAGARGEFVDATWGGFSSKRGKKKENGKQDGRVDLKKIFKSDCHAFTEGTKRLERNQTAQLTSGGKGPRISYKSWAKAEK